MHKITNEPQAPDYRMLMSIQNQDMEVFVYAFLWLLLFTCTLFTVHIPKIVGVDRCDVLYLFHHHVVPKFLIKV